MISMTGRGIAAQFGDVAEMAQARFPRVRD
jgi:hypothetical protein